MTKIINGTIRFTNGKKIDFELYPELAPISVENFISLSKENFYDGLCFHRVIPEFMIQGGGMVHGEKALKEKRSKTIKGEFIENGIENRLAHTPGVLSMARAQANDSASSQFFICVNTLPFLDGKYAAFGKVKDADSYNIAVEISQVPTHLLAGHDDVPVRAVEIQEIEVFDNNEET